MSTVLLNMSAVEELQLMIQDDRKNLNQFFLLIMGAMVLLMQSGFAFLEAGSVRAKNVVKKLLSLFKKILGCQHPRQKCP
jgi:Amt family ammonium transporter